MEREACVCDHGFERSDLCAEIIKTIMPCKDEITLNLVREGWCDRDMYYLWVQGNMKLRNKLADPGNSAGIRVATFWGGIGGAIEPPRFTAFVKVTIKPLGYSIKSVLTWHLGISGLITTSKYHHGKRDASLAFRVTRAGKERLPVWGSLKSETSFQTDLATAVRLILQLTSQRLPRRATY